MRSTLRCWWQHSSFLTVACLLLMFASDRACGEIYKFGGYRIKVTFTLEHPEMMLGIPAYLTFTVHNSSDEDWWVLQGGDDINRFHRPESFSITVTDTDGRAIPQPDAGDDIAGDSMCGPQKIPAHRNYTFYLLMSSWATLTEPGTYTVTVKKTLILGRWKDSDFWEKKHQAIPIQLVTSIKVVPPDAERISTMISKLGNTMLHGPHEKACAAADTLAYFTDARAVPYFVQAARKPDYNLMFTALDALGQYNDAEAFRALQRGLFITAKDLGSEVAKSKLDGISFDALRFDAACALCKSPYPNAFPYLVSMRRQLDEKARNSIAIRLKTKMSSAEAIPILHELARDPDEGVRLDAGLSLAARQRQQTNPPAPTLGE